MRICFLLFKYLYKLFKLIKKGTIVLLTKLPNISRIRFSLCSVIPKGSRIGAELTVQLWMSHRLHSSQFP